MNAHPSTTPTDAAPLDYSRPPARLPPPRWQRILARIQCYLAVASLAALPLGDFASTWIALAPTRYLRDVATARSAVAAWGQLLALAGLAVGFSLFFVPNRKEPYPLISYVALATCLLTMLLNC